MQHTPQSLVDRTNVEHFFSLSTYPSGQCVPAPCRLSVLALEQMPVTCFPLFSTLHIKGQVCGVGALGVGEGKGEGLGLGIGTHFQKSPPSCNTTEANHGSD